MQVAEFREKLQQYCHRGGISQKNLAAAIGLNHQVLSRKLNGIRKGSLNQLEVKQIVKMLAEWQLINTQDQAFELIELLDLPPAIFKPQEWQLPPLSQLSKSDPTAKRSLPESKPVAQAGSTSLAIAAPPEPKHNLPAFITPLIGREWVIKRVREIIGSPEARLVTVLGPGGIGKTRLALFVAREMLPEFKDGVFFVSLASLNDPQFVPSAILQTLQLKETANLSATARLKQYLASKNLLLVLDNFEQLLAGIALLDELLTAAPGLKLLVTSQAVLHIYGEREFSLPPLELPALAHLPDPAKLLDYEAVRLFVERARAVQPDFSLTAENYQAVAELCIRLDGLPLSIELAAARLKILSVYALLERLSDKRLTFLTRGATTLPPRQQSLRRTLEWSYRLLDESEQQLFDRLGIFRNGWTVEAAHAVCNPEATSETESLDDLSQLLDKSLVVRISSQSLEQRFTMLETLREFALERLNWRDEGQALRERHTQYYRKLAEQAELNLSGPDQVFWLDRLDQEQENLRAALQWLIEKAQAETLSPDTVSPENLAGPSLEATTLALQMAAALASYWDTRGYYSEGRHWLTQVLEISEGKPAEVRLMQARAKALNRLGDFAFLQGDFSQSRVYLEESLALKRQLEDKPGIAAVLNSFGNLAVWQREFGLALRVVEESLSIRQELNDSAGIAVTLRNLGNIYSATGEYQQAAEAFSKSLAIAERLNNKQGQAIGLGNLGRILLFQGHYEQAARLLKESLVLFEELGDKRRVAVTLALLGRVYMHQEQYEQAFQLLLKSLELERELGDRWGVATNLTNLGNLKLRQGQYDAARSLYLEGLESLCELGEKYIGDGLDNLAGLAIAQQDFEKAALLCAASDKLREQTNAPRESSQQVGYAKLLAALHDRFDEPSFNVAWSKGHALELDQALALARSTNYLGSGQD